MRLDHSFSAACCAVLAACWAWQQLKTNPCEMTWMVNALLRALENATKEFNFCSGRSLS